MDEKRARNEVTQLIEEDLRKTREKQAQMTEKIDQMIHALRDPTLKTKQVLEAENKLESLNTKIILLEWELKWQPVFLPYDSIYALRTKVKDGHKEYYAVVKNPDGSFREKLIPK